MGFLSDLLLTAAAIGAAAYCYILSRRLTALSSLEGGMGNAIAVLSSQVDDLTKLLRSAQHTAGQAGTHLTDQTERAEHAAKRLELLVASLHDLPAAPASPRDRAPSRWPPLTASRPQSASLAWPDQSEPGTADADTGTPRARVLRRRRDVEGA